MSVVAEAVFDVFLSHGAHDRGIAEVVKRAFAGAGLEIYAVHEVAADNAVLDEMRKALAECSAFVLILTRSMLESQNIALEIGMAMAWNKPVYVLYEGIAKPEIPEFLREFAVHPISRLPKIVDEILKSQQPMSDDQRKALVELYRKVGVPTDQLLRSPLAVRELAKKFNQILGTSLSGEKLVQELIRMRKQGKLPKIRCNAAS